MRAHLGEQIRRPVPAERRLQHHLGLRSGRGDRPDHLLRLVDDPRLRQQLAISVLADDHRPAPVQINTDIFSGHGNLLSSLR